MNASLRSLVSSNFDLRSFVPADAVFHIPAELEIGPKDESGADIFQIEICSPEWLEAHLGTSVELVCERPFFWTKRPFLVAQKYSYGDLISFVDEFLSEINGAAWEDLAREINKFALGEFDKYRE